MVLHRVSSTADLCVAASALQSIHLRRRLAAQASANAHLTLQLASLNSQIGVRRNEGSPA